MGANNIDDHFRNMPLDQNIPVLMGLLSVWNVSFLNYPARAILPYCQVSQGAGGGDSVSQPANASHQLSPCRLLLCCLLSVYAAACVLS
jgi:hypothetical protein